MTTEIKFFDLGYSFLNVDSVAAKAICHIKEKAFNSNVILDFNGCLLSYELSNILDAVIEKLEVIKGDKTLKIKHSYSQAFEGHLLSYFVKNAKKIKPESVNTVSVLEFFKKTYQIVLQIEKSGV